MTVPFQSDAVAASREAWIANRIHYRHCEVRKDMPISDLSDKDLDRFEASYRRANRTEGGKFSLSEILLEKRRRKPSAFSVREVAAKIISPDFLEILEKHTS